MALRLMSCAACGHRLRLGARHCGRCHAETPLINRRGTLFILAAVLVAGAMFAWFGGADLL